MASLPERGASLVLVLAVLLVVSFLAMMLLFATQVELRSSAGSWGSARAAAAAASGVQEVLWRLNLKPGAGAPPYGSTVTVNGLQGFDAAIDYDPQGLLRNLADDDADGRVDEPDELNLGRDWTVRVLLTPLLPAPGPPWALVDADLAHGPPWGSKLVVPTIQPQATWLTYSTDDPSASDVLTVRFLLDVDRGAGDVEEDGPEIVFHDPDLATNGVDDRNTLSGLGGDGNPANDSPYNITWSDGATVYRASGEPVLLVQATGRVLGSGRTAARRRVEATAVRNNRTLFTRALCALASLSLSSDSTTLGATTDSYRSSEGGYGAGPLRHRGDVGSNGSITVSGKSRVDGDAEATLAITFTSNGGTVTGNARAGGLVSGTNRTVLGSETSFATPIPFPCGCDSIGVPGLVAEARQLNDDALILPDGVHPYVSGTSQVSPLPLYTTDRNLVLGAGTSIILTGGSYYFDSVTVWVGGSIQAGVDSNGDGLVDARPPRPVRIYVAGAVDLRGNAVINPGKPGDLQLYSSALPPAEVGLRGVSEFRGLIDAPGTRIWMDGNTVLNGAAIGATIDLFKATVHFDEDVVRAPVTRVPYVIGSWREVE